MLGCSGSGKQKPQDVWRAAVGHPVGCVAREFFVVVAKSWRAGIAEMWSYMAFPREYWRSQRTNNSLERIRRELRRTRVVGNFLDGESALMSVAARLRHVAGTKWGKRSYLDRSRLDEA